MKRSTQWIIAGVGLAGLFAYIKSDKYGKGILSEFGKKLGAAYPSTVNFKAFTYEEDFKFLGGQAGIQKDFSKGIPGYHYANVILTSVTPSAGGYTLIGKITNPDGISASFLSNVKTLIEMNGYGKDLAFSKDS